MGVDFINLDNEDLRFRINHRGWRRIFRLAVMFGWEPQGTRQPYGDFQKAPWHQRDESSFAALISDPPDDQFLYPRWDSGDYFSNFGQEVTDQDAFALADAVESAIPLLMVRDAKDNPSEKYGEDWEDEMVLRCQFASLNGLRDPNFIFFDYTWKEKLTELVDFCRHGGFVIF